MRTTWTLLLLFGLYPLQSHAAVDQKPNIVVLLADDLGWNAVGWQNPEYETPHLDRLAKQGVTWEQFYVAPMCSPTRAGLMTGRY
ncbi:MAG: sulfatase-like hydrolase/transferase, partial [Planctomycetaceae bacterium]|nr:sulfatase-like hydrolase/transferase [Planctomycetaceae bacterium]